MNLLSMLGGLIVKFVPFLVCLSIHEASHAWVANMLGDPTSKYDGRLSLNPIKHIDLFGTILLPLFLILSGNPGFGYAKPVMIDPRNFKNHQRDMYLTALAGPGSNIIFALIIGILISIFPVLSPLVILVEISIGLAVFNLVPIPPLDGSKILQFLVSEDAYDVITKYGFFVLIFLIFFTSVFNYLYIIDFTVSNFLIHLF